MIGKRLKFLRNESKMTQSELAKKINKSRATVAGYEIDDRKPDIETIKKISEIFDEDADWLLGLTEQRSVKTVVDMPEFLADKLEMLANSNESDFVKKNTVGEMILDDSLFSKIIDDPEFHKRIAKETSLMNDLMELYNIPKTAETREEMLFFLMELGNKYKDK